MEPVASDVSFQGASHNVLFSRPALVHPLLAARPLHDLLDMPPALNGHVGSKIDANIRSCVSYLGAMSETGFSSLAVGDWASSSSKD